MGWISKDSSGLLFVQPVASNFAAHTECDDFEAGPFTDPNEAERECERRNRIDNPRVFWGVVTQTPDQARNAAIHDRNRQRIEAPKRSADGWERRG